MTNESEVPNSLKMCLYIIWKDDTCFANSQLPFSACQMGLKSIVQQTSCQAQLQHFKANNASVSPTEMIHSFQFLCLSDGVGGYSSRGVCLLRLIYFIVRKNKRREDIHLRIRVKIFTWRKKTLENSYVRIHQYHRYPSIPQKMLWGLE